MKLTPLHDRIVITEDDVKETTRGGIIIPGQARNIPTTGTVVSAGPGKYVGADLVPITVKENDRIVYVKGAGDIIEVDGVEMRIIQDEHVIGIIS